MSYRPTRNVFLLSLTSFFNDLSSEMILSVFPAFFVSVLKAGAGSLGLVEGIADGASNIIKIYSGRLSDRLQKRKPFILLGYSLSVITRPIYLMISTVGGVVGLRFIDRVGKGLRDSPRDAIISISTPPDEIGRAFGYHRAFDTLGAIGGPLVVYLILRNYPDAFNSVFLIAFFIGIIAVISLFFIKDMVGSFAKMFHNNNGNHSDHQNSTGVVEPLSPAFKRYLVALFFLSIGSIPVAVMLLKTTDFGFTLASIPLFYLIYNISYAGFAFTAGKWSDKFGPRKVLVAGYLLLIIGYIFIHISTGAVSLAIGFLVLGLFPALTDGVQRAFASMLSNQDHRGSAFGFVNGISGIGLLIAGICGGYTWQIWGPGTAFFVASIFVIIGIFVLSTVHMHRGVNWFEKK